MESKLQKIQKMIADPDFHLADPAFFKFCTDPLHERTFRIITVSYQMAKNISCPAAELDSGQKPDRTPCRQTVWSAEEC